jgi:uncharacterized protein (DUF58 family)
MPSPGTEATRLAAAWRLGLADRPQRGPAGERLGRGTGSSLEFQDRRAYVAGDDVRHLDWGAYARTDQMMVRLYREEILPTVEILIDGSRSMAVDDDKAQLTADVVGLLAGCARADGLGVRLVRLGERAELLEAQRFEVEGLVFDGASPLAAVLDDAGGLLRPGALRILVSDFLSPHDPAQLVRPLGARAGGLALVQLLGAEDARPPVGEALRLEDVEGGTSLDLVLDQRTVDAYLVRLRHLQDGLALEARRAAGLFVTLESGPSLETHCRGRLAGEGLLVPA